MVFSKHLTCPGHACGFLHMPWCSWAPFHALISQQRVLLFPGLRPSVVSQPSSLAPGDCGLSVTSSSVTSNLSKTDLASVFQVVPRQIRTGKHNNVPVRSACSLWKWGLEPTPGRWAAIFKHTTELRKGARSTSEHCTESLSSLGRVGWAGGFDSAFTERVQTSEGFPDLSQSHLCPFRLLFS